MVSNNISSYHTLREREAKIAAPENLKRRHCEDNTKSALVTGVEALASQQ